MYRLVDLLVDSEKVERIPNSVALCIGNRLITNLVQQEETAQLWIEGKLQAHEVLLLLAEMFGHVVTCYDFVHIVSGETGKEETQVNLTRIPAVISVGLTTSQNQST